MTLGKHSSMFGSLHRIGTLTPSSLSRPCRPVQLGRIHPPDPYIVPEDGWKYNDVLGRDLPFAFIIGAPARRTANDTAIRGSISTRLAINSANKHIRKALISAFWLSGQ
jgi:hypothetical protein